MSNALKFTPRGGRITLSVSATPDGGQTLIVKDTGPGIPKEEIPRVMQAFGQGSLAHQTAEGGTGLGLPIVQNLVNSARRHVRAALRAAQGHRGRGLPAGKPGAAHHAAPAAAGPGAPPPAGPGRAETRSRRGTLEAVGRSGGESTVVR